MASRAAAQAHKPNAAHNRNPTANSQIDSVYGFLGKSLVQACRPAASQNLAARRILILFINYWSYGLCLLIFQFIYRSNCLIVFRDRQLFPALSGESSYKSCITIASLSKDGCHDTAVRVLPLTESFSAWSLNAHENHIFPAGSRYFP